MIDEKYRKNNDNNDNVTLRTALKGAAVAGIAGLAMAYQPWGYRATRFLGRVVSTAKTTFKSMETIRQGESVRYYTKTDYGQLRDNLKSAWANSAGVADNLRFNVKSHGSLAAYIQSTEVMISQAKQKAQDAWVQDYLHKDALEQLKSQNFDRNTASNVRSFLAKAVQNAENFGRNMELARQHKLEGQALSFAEQISRDIQARWDAAIVRKQGADADIIQKLSSSIEQELKKHAYNIDTMERALGTARKKTMSDYGILALSHAHKMTWKEAKTLGSAIKSDAYPQGKSERLVSDAMKDIERFVQDTQGDEAFKRLMQITVDQHNLFVASNGKAFNKEVPGQIWREFLAWSRNTLPGKLFKIGDIDNALRQSATQMIRITADDPILASRLKKMGEDDKYHIRIGKDIYSLDLNRDEGSRMYLNPELNNGDIRFVSGKYGFYHTQLEALSGKTKTSISDNWLFRTLDIFQDREEYSGNFIANKLSMFTGKNGRKERFFGQLKMSPEYEERWQSAIEDLNNFAHDPNADFMTTLSEDTKDFVLEYIETQKKISEIFRSNTHKLELGSIDALLASSKINDHSKKLLKILQTDDETEILTHLMDSNSDGKLKIRTATGHYIDFLNGDLRTLISSVRNSPEMAKSNISLVTNELGLSYGSDLINLFRAPMGNTTYLFGDILKREVAKEALLRQGLPAEHLIDDTINYDKINELLEDVTLTDLNRKRVERLAQFGIWQKYTGINTKVGVDNALYMDYYKRMMTTDDLLRGTDDKAKKFQDVYSETMADEISWLEEQVSSEAPGVGSLDEYVAINRSASPLDIVQGLNKAIFLQDTSKIKADVMNIVRGLSANREDMSGANLYTFVPFFAFKRLSDELNRVGLGFSSESTKSTMDLAMSFMTKRVLPIAVGATYLDLTDDITKEATGTGLWEAFTAGVANVDLAGRRVISAVGLDEWMKQTKAVNPIWQYWGDKDDYQGYEERVRYYQKGYTPVRKAAWWTWGGISEARGGEIQYWEPNIVRRASSNAYDAAMYDSLWEKWSHSLIPTPINPLSPLFAVLNPYYLERKHSEDRPYVLSGPMFTEGTPWGAVLNPTISAFIKPEKELHSFRFDHGIDIVSLLHNANESIRERARDITRTHYITVKGGEVSAVDWNSYDAPTPDTRVMSIRTNGGLVGINTGIYGVYGDGSKGYGFGAAGGAGTGTYGISAIGRSIGGGVQQNVAAGFNSFADDRDISLHYNTHILAHPEHSSVREALRAKLFGDDNGYVHNGDIVVNEQGELGIYQNRSIADPRGVYFTAKEQLAIDAVTKKIAQDDRLSVYNIADENIPVDIVKGINEDIIGRSRQHIDSPYAVDEDLGFATNEKLSSFNPSQSMELLNDADAVDDLLNQGNGSDFVRNATTSMRLIGGIYGYMGSELVGLGVHEDKTLANSSDMYAFNRTFWDLNLGGAGGAVSEIGRRFIPNFQRLSKVNPLMNEMPDWLPDRFRMGDPMCITESTLVEQGNIQFVIAKDIQVQDMLLSHKGILKRTLGVVKRPVKDNETIYQFQIASLSAVTSKYSEDHPLLIYDGSNITNIKYSNHSHEELSKYKRYNDIIVCLSQGIVRKKDIALITGINIDWIYIYFKDLYELGIIENYKIDKHKIIPIPDKLQLFDLDMIKNHLIWCKAKNIKIGDYVAYPVPKYNSTEIIIDMTTVIDYPHSDKYIYVSGQCQSQDFIEAYEWLEINDSTLTHKRGERKQILKRFNWNEKAYENAQSMIRQHRVPERMNRYINLTPELCYAIGLYIAEGYHNTCGISYALNIKEKQLFDRSVQAFIDAGFNIRSYSFKRRNNTNGAVGDIFCKALLPFMDYLVGHLAHNKCLNDILWNLKDNNLLRLLEGYIDGDGCNNIIQCGINNRKSYRVGISSCNLTLLLQIRKLALRFGVVFKIQHKGTSHRQNFINGKQINTGINYNASIIGESAIHFAKLLWNIDVQVPTWSKKSPRHAFIHNGYVFMRVQNITEYTKDDYPYVYGFSMEDDKSFCTAGVATHNTKIPKGEMRLPGKGYEALNELHPDQFSTEKDRYGSFDRFKILADIAPNSPEYKLWREIAKRTVTDPELLDEMEEIKQRARQQGKKHDFYKYNIVGKDYDYQNIVISEVLGYGKFRSGDTIYKMAGITVQGNPDENAQEVLSRYLRPGQEVTIAVDTNQAYGKNKDAQKTVNAAVFVQGESVNKMMLEAGDARERKGDKSAAATVAQLSGLQQAIGLVSEVIGHLDIPIISDQWLRIRSPYESYLAEEVYGTSYQSWSHPINTFLYPAIERAIHERSSLDLIIFDAFTHMQETGEFNFVDLTKYDINFKLGTGKLSRGPKHAIYMASILANRATLVGHAIGNMIDAGNSKLAIPISRGLNVAVTAAHMLTGGTSMHGMATLGLYTGVEVARINEVKGFKNIAKYGAAGAAISVGYRMLHNALFGEWVPDRQKKKWDMQDYWDRLNYIKWQGLYKEAARRALDEEGVDVERFLETTDKKEKKRKATIEKLKGIKESLNEAYGGKTNYLKNYLLKLVNSRIAELKPPKNMVEGGQYTQSAIIYKRAAEATIYGLKKGASWSSIISALPANDREYFMEFVTENDKNKRDKILSIVSPSLKKALQMSWGMKPDKQEDNEDFFKDHYLPDADWKGWRPDVDLNDIAVKTIANEAMNLSDFGFYESSLREPEVEEATPLPYNERNDDIRIGSEIKSLLKGKGLHNVEVSVTAKNTMGATDIIANIAVWAGLKDQQRRVEDSVDAWI